jgi:heptosyltransferase-1
LIVKISALGDIIHSLPVAMAIKRQRPRVMIDWVVEAPAYGLLANHPAINRALLSPRHSLRQNFFAGLPQIPAFVKELRAVDYDAVLDLQGLMKSSLFVLLARGRRKLGFQGGKEPLAALALNEPLPPYDIERHALERYLDMLTPLGLQPPAQVEYGIVPQPEDLAAWRRRLGAKGKLAVLHPAAKWPSKLWPEAHWALLALALVKSGVRVVISGSAEDRAGNQRIAALAGNVRGLSDLSGQSTLPQLTALLSMADLVVSTDTGVMHLAAALNCPLLALFGPTAPNRTGPYGSGHTVLFHPLPCRPCFKRSCPHGACMRGLTPETVIAAAYGRLGLPRPFLD